ncbi:bifunctional UDP-N-acetylglucosamine diphosphorylase/glucosamine-1-phosphate N-acetyltransferase GlmU [soil metagenome]
MKSRLPKVLHPICGRPMLAYVVDAAREATGGRPLVVYSPQTAQICDAFPGQADFALQDEPRGTGDALRAALAALTADVNELVVLSGDVPLIDAATIAALLKVHRGRGATLTLATNHESDPTGYGRIVRDDSGRVSRIVEEKDATAGQLGIDETNSGAYVIDGPWIRNRIGDLTPSAATGELYLTQLIEMAAADGAIIGDLEQTHAQALHGVNDREELAHVDELLRSRINERLMLAGVTLQQPSSTFIEATVEIAADVTIEANVSLRGNTRLGRETVIRSGSQVIDSTVGQGCTIWASIVEGSTVGDGVRIGPFSHLRGGCVVGDGAEIGNFAEMKNTRFGARSKMHHFGYLGDADVGQAVNIGAGTITANYDGVTKNRTSIGDGAFIGSDTILRAPVSVGRGAYTGAGSVVTRDVPDGKLAVGVPARIRERRQPA